MKHLLTYIALMGLAMVSCNKQENIRQDNPLQEIRFAASMGQYAVKATDTAFELDDAIGLTIGAPVGVTNLKLTMGEDGLVPDAPVYWGKDQAADQATDFYAYYPYVPGCDLAEGFEFSIRVEQTLYGLFHSDLMTAVTSSTPQDGMVNLPFRHRLSRLILDIDNQLESEIMFAYVGNVYGKVFVRQDELETRGYPGIVKASRVMTVGGESARALILPPQTTVPKLMITTEDGKQFTFEAEEEVTFVSGYSYRAHVTLDGNTIYTDFTEEVEEWVGNSDVQFSLSDFAEVFGGTDGEQYTVTGMVYDVVNEEYGNFYMRDSEGSSLYIYGTKNADRQYPRDVDLGWKNADFSLCPGDVVTVRGERGTYGSTVELVDVTIVSADRKSVAAMNYTKDVSFTGGKVSVCVRLRNPDSVASSTNVGWIHDIEGPIEDVGDWYTIRFSVDANIVDGDNNYEARKARVSVWDEMNSITLFITQAACPIEIEHIKDVIAVPNNTPVSFGGVVYAVSSCSYMVYDGEAAMHVYLAQAPTCQVGDMVRTTGTKVLYQGQPEITNVEYEVLSSGNELKEIEYMDISSTFDSFTEETSVPVQVEGTLSIVSNQAYVTVDGAEKQVFVYWHPDLTSLTALEGQRVLVKGFYFGAHGNYKDIVATSVEPQQVKWSIIGDIEGSSWDKDFYLEKTIVDGKNAYYGLFFYDKGQQFRIRKNASYYEANMSSPDSKEHTLPVSFTAVNDGEFIMLDYSGVIDILFFPEDNQVSINESNTGDWSFVSSENGLLAMEPVRTQVGTDIYEGSFIIWQYDYQAGESFVFQYSGSEDLAFGLDKDDTADFWPNFSFAANTLVRSGKPIVLPQSGKYKISFNFTQRELQALLLDN